ncbi:hypothetical protein BABINDRAFT_8826 [Babjeviella inositovora NRRL Y-12698]|uniref:Protein kinase domain-containing protein n=1 Tax=Babjeviella inositovora NRRL Y-12698 TaxID=984486 RepID=A0A1E3QNG0_9ASCO|nr:uncharacterized protein BABINDRAFT_8826 [Babjeviella inositovora NRRL Y-12698]ODQ79246.1 hypothetical protein BABINDRAFT_8826 [Babjeviella inositovora NRRL Y-12698]
MSLIQPTRKRPRGFSDHYGPTHDGVLTKNPFSDHEVIVVHSEDPEDSPDGIAYSPAANGEVIEDYDMGHSTSVDRPSFYTQQFNQTHDAITLDLLNLNHQSHSYNYQLAPKKQRTNSLPQLPHVSIQYLRPPSVDHKIKLGEVRPTLVPYALNQPPCDDKDGHYIITPGEPFANLRYVIKKLLGQGTFGKVVSAWDRSLNQMVAIKIIKNIPKYREASKIELRVLSTLKAMDDGNDNHCIHLRECFDYRGHICLVTNLLRISLYDFLDSNAFEPFPGSHIQAIAKQLLRSVTFLHDLNLVHTDLKPENILLYNDEYTKRTIQGKKPITTKVLKDPLIQIIDFGLAIFDDEYHSTIVSTRHYRAPEIVLGIGWSFACDLWLIGCILCELLTGEALFRTHENMEHLAMMEKILGELLLARLVRRCRKAHERNGAAASVEIMGFFETPEAAPYTDVHNAPRSYLRYPKPETKKKSIKYVAALATLEQMISSRVNLELDPRQLLYENFRHNEHRIDFENFQFWWYFLDLVRKLLTFDPRERITAADALNHPWFDCGINDYGTGHD